MLRTRKAYNKANTLGLSKAAPLVLHLLAAGDLRRYRYTIEGMSKDWTPENSINRLYCYGRSLYIQSITDFPQQDTVQKAGKCAF